MSHSLRRSSSSTVSIHDQYSHATTPEPKKAPPKKRKASEMEVPGEVDNPSPAKKVRAKPAPRVTKGRAKGV
jgi:hypothetical protein